MTLIAVKDHSSTVPYVLAKDPAPLPIDHTRFSRLSDAEKQYADTKVPGFTPPAVDSGIDVAMHDTTVSPPGRLAGGKFSQT